MQPDLFASEPVDLCAGRHQGAAESVDAFEQKVAPTLARRQAEVLEFVRGRGEQGATVHEVAAAFGTTPNAVSGRLSELKAQGRLRKNGERRDGAAVHVAVTDHSKEEDAHAESHPP